MKDEVIDMDWKDGASASTNPEAMTKPPVGTVTVNVDYPPELAPLLGSNIATERAKARIWGAVALLVQVIALAAVVPLVILAAKLTVLAWGMGL